MLDLLGSVVAANPCPPLPLKCTRKDPATDRHVEGFANTHHVLMQAYAFAIQRDSALDNAQREITQTKLTHAFITAFQSNVPPEKLYDAATTFTRSYLHSFMPNRPVPDARFAPYDEISSCTYENNPIVKAACEHLSGMIYYDEYPDENASASFDDAGVQVQCRSYEEILDSLKNVAFSEVLHKYAQVHMGRQQASPGIEELE